MNTEKERLDFKTSFCSKYEELLVECQNALEVWAKRREEAWQMGWHGKEIGGELVHLQATFAKSYAVLQKHTRECPLCEFVSKIAKDDPSPSPYVTVMHHHSRPA
jgi:hypothetical protein